MSVTGVRRHALSDGLSLLHGLRLGLAGRETGAAHKRPSGDSTSEERSEHSRYRA